MCFDAWDATQFYYVNVLFIAWMYCLEKSRVEKRFSHEFPLLPSFCFATVKLIAYKNNFAFYFISIKYHDII